MKLIVESQYFPPVILFKKISRSIHIIFEQYEPYRKMSFRNRCVIAGAGGPVTLSVPVELGRSQRTIMKDVRIANRYSWQTRHWKTIVSCYNRSPWFEHYRDDLEALYQQRYEFLQDWNLACFAWVIKKIDLACLFELTPDYQPLYTDKAYVDYRNKVIPKTLADLDQPLYYRQVFEEKSGFIPHLSILDLLFCEGKATRNLLENG